MGIEGPWHQRWRMGLMQQYALRQTGPRASWRCVSSRYQVMLWGQPLSLTSGTPTPDQTPDNTRDQDFDPLVVAAMAFRGRWRCILVYTSDVPSNANHSCQPCWYAFVAAYFTHRPWFMGRPLSSSLAPSTWHPRLSWLPISILWRPYIRRSRVGNRETADPISTCIVEV